MHHPKVAACRVAKKEKQNTTFELIGEKPPKAQGNRSAKDMSKRQNMTVLVLALALLVAVLATVLLVLQPVNPTRQDHDLCSVSRQTGVFLDPWVEDHIVQVVDFSAQPFGSTNGPNQRDPVYIGDDPREIQELKRKAEERLRQLAPGLAEPRN